MTRAPDIAAAAAALEEEGRRFDAGLDTLQDLIRLQRESNDALVAALRPGKPIERRRDARHLQIRQPQ